MAIYCTTLLSLSDNVLYPSGIEFRVPDNIVEMKITHSHDKKQKASTRKKQKTDHPLNPSHTGGHLVALPQLHAGHAAVGSAPAGAGVAPAGAGVAPAGVGVAPAGVGVAPAGVGVAAEIDWTTATDFTELPDFMIPQPANNLLYHTGLTVGIELNENTNAASDLAS